ncbi:MAG: phosphoribosyltransferase [Pseudomonadota bacterium]
MEYRNFKDLNQCIIDHLHLVPSDVNLIVGIPRSGMPPALLLALHLDLPVTDLQGLMEGRLMKGGDRMRFVPTSDDYKVLIVDDSIFTGSAFTEARQQLADANLPHECLFLSVYVRDDRKDDVDIYFEELKGRKWLFEWNKFNHGSVPNMCMDFDGVLCRDPSKEEDDDGERYLNFIKTAEPLFRVRRKIGWIVTSRLEKYRAPTVEWLERHNIEYGELRMMDLPSLSERTSSKANKFKARVYNETSASLFVEGHLGHSAEIARISGRPVLCPGHAELVQPTGFAVARGRVKRQLQRRGLL